MKTIKPKHLTAENRVRIEALLSEGLSLHIWPAESANLLQQSQGRSASILLYILRSAVTVLISAAVPHTMYAALKTAGKNVKPAQGQRSTALIMSRLSAKPSLQTFSTFATHIIKNNTAALKNISTAPEPHRNDTMIALSIRQRLLRYIVPKGISIDSLNQRDMTLTSNHINKSLFGKPPYGLARQPCRRTGSGSSDLKNHF